MNCQIYCPLSSPLWNALVHPENSLPFITFCLHLGTSVVAEPQVFRRPPSIVCRLSRHRTHMQCTINGSSFSGTTVVSGEKRLAEIALAMVIIIFFCFIISCLFLAPGSCFASVPAFSVSQVKPRNNKNVIFPIYFSDFFAA